MILEPEAAAVACSARTGEHAPVAPSDARALRHGW